MFCEQCEQTASGNGCHQWGACGKSPEVNAVQDLLVYCLRGLAPVTIKARELAISCHEADIFTGEALFATMTNVNFNRKRFTTYIQQCIDLRDKLKATIEKETNEPIKWSEITNYKPNFSESLSLQGQQKSLTLLQNETQNIDIFSLKLTVLYGIKGTASYNFHAQELGQEDDRVYAFIQEALAAMDRDDLSLNDWVNLALK
jgi:hydroxylamine reductase